MIDEKILSVHTPDPYVPSGTVNSGRKNSLLLSLPKYSQSNLSSSAEASNNCLNCVPSQNRPKCINDLDTKKDLEKK